MASWRSLLDNLYEANIFAETKLSGQEQEMLSRQIAAKGASVAWRTPLSLDMVARGGPGRTGGVAIIMDVAWAMHVDYLILELEAPLTAWVAV